MKSPERICVIPLRFIGDAVLTVPLLRAVRQQWPQARIDLRLPRALHNLFEPCPYVDRLIPEEKGFFKNLKVTRQGHYDLAFLLRRTVTQAMELKLAGVPCVVGFNQQRWPKPLGYQPWGVAMDKTVPFVPLDTETPQVKTILSVLAPVVSRQDFDESLELWTTHADEAWMTHKLQENHLASSRLAVFHATSASREKALDPSVYIPSLQALHQAGFSIVCVGVAQDRDFYTALSAQSGVPLVNWCGDTTLRQSVALFKHTELLLSLDSGPVHMAAAVGVPHIVAIYGPINHKQWSPYPYHGQFTPVFHPHLTCRPCEAKVCAHNHCRTQMDSQWILDAVQWHLSHQERVGHGVYAGEP